MVCDVLKKLKNFHFDLSHLLHLTFYFDAWKNKVNDSQLLANWDELWYDLMAKIVVG